MPHPPSKAITLAMRSLRSRLWVLWAMTAAASLGVAALLFGLYQQSTRAQVERAQVEAASGCAAIRGRYAFYTRGWDGGDASLHDPALRRSLAALVSMALFQTPRLQGGIWSAEGGSLADSGATALHAISTADHAAIAAVNHDADDGERDIARVVRSSSGTSALAACPLETPLPGMTAWTREPIQFSVGLDRLRLGLALLLFVVFGMSGWLSWLVLLWSRHVGRMEAALSQGGPAMPELARTGERELDRIVDALNDAGSRLAEGQRQGEALARRVASSERLAALGRVAAGVAHEIRNPIASMQLKAENALAGDDMRRQQALEGMLGQIARLDGLVINLLAFTQKREARPREVAVAVFLARLAEEHRVVAGFAGITLRTITEVADAHFDPELVARVLDNLVSNAVQCAGAGAVVTIACTRTPDTLRMTVTDTGPGVAAGLRQTLFEPFVTGRPNGTGLGLAIARECAEVHGGRLTLLGPPGEVYATGASFTLELPCLPS